MATYEVEINGQTYEIEAPDDQAVQLAVRQLQGQSAQQPAPDGGGFLGGLQSFGTGIVDLASSGFADELGAGARYLGGKILPWQSNVTYDQALEEVRAADRASAEANPNAYLAGQITGGVGLGAGLARAGLSPTMNAPQGASLLNRVVRGGVEGGILGGAYGLGSGEDAGDRGMQALTGAALGTAVGGAIPAVAAGASSAYRNITERMAANEAARRAGTTPEVARMLQQTLESDRSLGPRGQAAMQRAGQEAMLADAGPNARQILDVSIQRGGPGAIMAQDAIEQRVGRGAQDLTSALDQTLGAPQGVSTAREAVRKGTQASRSAAYKDAYSRPIDYADPRGQQIESIVKNRVPQSAISEANALMRAEGASSKQILANVADDGTVTFETLPDVQQLDYITRGLNEVAKKNEAAGLLGGQTALGRAYEGLSREIRSNLRNLVPEYGTALDVAGDAISQSQAIKFGSKMLSPAVARDEVAQTVLGMSASDKQGLAQGIRSQIDEEVANVTRSIQDGNMDAREAVKSLKKLSSRANREKLSLAIGDEPAQQLFDELDRIATSFDLRASVAENSKTFARQSLAEGVERMTAPGPVGTLQEGKPGKAIQRVIQAITGRTPEALAGRQNEIYSQIADLLTRPASQSIPAYQAMTNLSGQSAINQRRALEIARLLSASQPAAYPTSALLSGNTQ